MPGFNIGGKGSPANATVESKRQHRWTFTVDLLSGDKSGTSCTTYLQKAARPKYTLEVAEMHHDQEVAYFAGKSKWEPIGLTFYDISKSVDSSKQIWEWIQKVINIPGVQVNAPDEYKKFSHTSMNDGLGTSVETWDIYNSWPTETNWNDLDYTSSEIATIDVSLKFDRAIKTS